jgi:lipoate-protein ligase A
LPTLELLTHLMDVHAPDPRSEDSRHPALLPHATWRLLDTGWSDGATNMAIDEAILLGVAAGTSPPTLRFYGWQPPCVSVGYGQPLRDEIDLEACRRLGYTWVRRPTGGRAILHVDELTYSVVAPLKEPRVAGDILTSYRRLSTGLIAGLSRLGCKAAQAEEGANRRPADRSAACFDEPSPYEVMARGRKLVGSAQARRRRVVLQHGTLPLEGDVTRLGQVLALPEPERTAQRDTLRRRAITLSEALGRSVAFHEVTEALAEGFATALNLTLVRGCLSEGERAAMVPLRAKHEQDRWLFER